MGSEPRIFSFSFIFSSLYRWAPMIKKNWCASFNQCYRSMFFMNELRHVCVSCRLAMCTYVGWDLILFFNESSSRLTTRFRSTWTLSTWTSRKVCWTRVILVQIPAMLCDWEVKGHCTWKEMPAIRINKVVDKKRIIKNGGLRRRGTTGHWSTHPCDFRQF
jgi:hypothetical protein